MRTARAARQRRPETAPAAAANVACAAAALALAPATLTTTTEGDCACEGVADADELPLPVALCEGSAGGVAAALPLCVCVAREDLVSDAESGRGAPLRVALPLSEELGVSLSESKGRSDGIAASEDPEPLELALSDADAVGDPDSEALWLADSLALPLEEAVRDGERDSVRDSVSECVCERVSVEERVAATIEAGDESCDAVVAWLRVAGCEALGVADPVARGEVDGDAEGVAVPVPLVEWIIEAPWEGLRLAEALGVSVPVEDAGGVGNTEEDVDELGLSDTVAAPEPD